MNTNSDKSTTNPAPKATAAEPTIPLDIETVPPKKSRALVILTGLVILIVAIGVTYSVTRAVTHKTTVTTVANPAAVAPAEVTINSTGFSPSTVVVKVNQGVVWTNTDTASHEVNSDPYPTNNTLSSFNTSAPIPQNGSWDYVFAKAGTYTYHDNLNPYTFKGTIIVK
jgi:plastocyanin